MSHWLWAIAIATKAAVLCLGLVILYYVTRAAFHSNDRGLWFLTVGIALTGVGLLLGDVLSLVVGVDAPTAMTVTGTVSSTGLLAVVYSMFTDAHLASDQVE